MIGGDADAPIRSKPSRLLFKEVITTLGHFMLDKDDDIDIAGGQDLGFFYEDSFANSRETP